MTTFRIELSYRCLARSTCRLRLAMPVPPRRIACRTVSARISAACYPRCYPCVLPTGFDESVRSLKSASLLAIKSRGGRIRTDDILLPKQALYQAELHLEVFLNPNRQDDASQSIRGGNPWYRHRSLAAASTDPRPGPQHRLNELAPPPPKKRLAGTWRRTTLSGHPIAGPPSAPQVSWTAVLHLCGELLTPEKLTAPDLLYTSTPGILASPWNDQIHVPVSPQSRKSRRDAPARCARRSRCRFFDPSSALPTRRASPCRSAGPGYRGGDR